MNIEFILTGQLQPISELKLTGGGAVKYADIIRERLGERVKVIHVDEMKSLANGIKYYSLSLSSSSLSPSLPTFSSLFCVSFQPSYIHIHAVF